MKARLLRIIVSMCAAFAVAVLVVGCEQERAASGPPSTAAAPAQPEPKGVKVARIVFVGKKNACECTRKRVDDSFAALQTVLEGRSEIAVQRLQVDVDEAGVKQYRELRPIMVLPAIYLLEASGALIDVLQGEVTVEQLEKATGGRSNPRPSATSAEKRPSISGG